MRASWRQLVLWQCHKVNTIKDDQGCTLGQAAQGPLHHQHCCSVTNTWCLITSVALQDHSLRLWNFQTQVCVCVMNGHGAHTNEVLSLVRNTALMLNVC